MPNFYRTALGQKVDIDRMRVVNERSMAVGNMPVNARGDHVAPNGEIVKSRSEVMKERYTKPVVKYTPKQKPGTAPRTTTPTAAPAASVPRPASTAPAPTGPTVGPEHQLAKPAATDIRGSLASEVSVDLTDYKPKPPRTLKRI